jgi:hypothetical protein
MPSPMRVIQEIPRLGSMSPWGMVDSLEPFRCSEGCEAPAEDDGVRWVGTPSHGGICLPMDLAVKMPACVVEASHLKMAAWWEEDCDCAWPILLLGLGCEHDQKAARAWLVGYKPELLARAEKEMGA